MCLVIKKRGISTMKVLIQRIFSKVVEVVPAPIWGIWATYSRCSWAAVWVAWAAWAEDDVQAAGVEWVQIHSQASIWDKVEMVRSPLSDSAEQLFLSLKKS